VRRSLVGYARMSVMEKPAACVERRGCQGAGEVTFSNGYVKRTESLTGVARRRYTASAVERIIIDKHTTDTK
jgi:hypothetical protein